MEITPEINKKLELLNEKYAALGQDLSSYLDGLLHAEVTTYWDYIEIETLLSLQKPVFPMKWFSSYTTKLLNCILN